MSGVMRVNGSTGVCEVVTEKPLKGGRVVVVREEGRKMATAEWLLQAVIV